MRILGIDLGSRAVKLALLRRRGLLKVGFMIQLSFTVIIAPTQIKR